MNKIKFLVLLCLIPLFGVSQHYIGQKKTHILTQYVYDTDVVRMNLTRDTLRGVDMEILSYYYSDKTYYYYINPASRMCEYFAALFNSPSARDSLITLYDQKYKRVPNPTDYTAMAWLEYGDDINYRHIVRDYVSPTCVVILGVTKNVDD